MNYGNRSSIRKILASPFVLFFVLIIFTILARATWKVHQKEMLSSSKLAQTQGELERLKTRQIELENQLGYLSSEEGVEAELRTKYRAVREGESVAVIIDTSQADVVQNRVNSATTSPGWFKRMLRGLGL